MTEKEEQLDIRTYQLDMDKIQTIDDIKDVLSVLAPTFTVKDRAHLGVIKDKVKEVTNQI